MSEANRRGYILVAPRGLGSGGGDNSNNSWSFSGPTTGLDGDGVNSNVTGDTNAVCDANITPDYSYRSCAGVLQNTCSWTHCQADDVEFAVALLDHVKGKLCVDSNNVFASGGSNGGMFTWELGQDPVSAGIFRAIAPLIGLPHRAYLNGKGKSGDMPALLITGTSDNVVPPGAWDDPSFTTTSNGSDCYYYTGATRLPGAGRRTTAVTCPVVLPHSTTVTRHPIVARTVRVTQAGRGCSTVVHGWAIPTACPGRGS